MRIADRITRAESRMALDKPHRWVRIIWAPGQRLLDALRGAKRTDNLILRRIVDAKDGKPVPDPIHDKDRVMLTERLHL